MFNSGRAQTIKSRSSARRAGLSWGVAAVMFVLAVSFVAAALAAGTGLTLGSASNSTLGKQVVISAQGRTLYSLSPETTKHLLCKSGECLKHWPPVTVLSSKTKLKAGTGVVGHLGILKRSNGTFQVTLRGLPLYRYVQDHARGDANGDGIESFGGIWHAVTAASSTHTTTPSAPTTPSMPSSPPSYPYP